MTRAVPKRPVLLTRPIGQNEALQQRFQEHGYETIAFPALAVRAAADPSALDAALAQLEAYALVIFVSPNAIDFALERRAGRWPAAVPIAVMGPGSRAKLAARGIAAPQVHIVTPREGAGARFDSEALYAALDIDSLVGRRCLMVRGNGGRDWLGDALKAKAVKVESVAAYQREVGAPGAAAIERVSDLVGSNAAALVTLTSSEAVERLMTLFQQHYGAAGLTWLHRQGLVVSHRRIAENATARGFDQVHLAEPGDEALLRAIEYLS